MAVLSKRPGEGHLIMMQINGCIEASVEVTILDTIEKVPEQCSRILCNFSIHNGHPSACHLIMQINDV